MGMEGCPQWVHALPRGEEQGSCLLERGEGAWHFKGAEVFPQGTVAGILIAQDGWVPALPL